MAANSVMCQPSGCTSSRPVQRLHQRTGQETDTRTSDKCPDTDSSCKRLDPPVFIEPLEDCSVDEGGDITLRGVIAGSQPIKVTWLHNGEVARFGKHSFNGREMTFVVKESLPEDAGAYTCLAENSAGKTSCCAAVFVRDFETIYAVPNRVSNVATSAFKSIMENGQSPKDEPAVFRGTISSSPTDSDKLSPVLTPREVIPKKRANSRTAFIFLFFLHTLHLQIVDGPELWEENTDQSSTLVIAEAKPQHTGRYTVVVRDRKNSAEHTLTLSVIERPQPPASCPVISIISDTSLVLSWSGPCYDGGSAILGYVVEVKKQGLLESGDWCELTSQCESTSYRVCSGLQPQQEYCFRVSAYNEVGKSEPGPVSPVVKMEQKDLSKLQEEEAPQAFTCVTIDSTHKVTDHYNLQEKLGVGKFGQVFKITHKETGRVCAGKFYKGRRAKEREAARKEIELMNYLHHPKAGSMPRCI
ncbi:Myosin light chain kinase, smooth muscle [Larimichthys crocea]|uniref:Uncharacterized protein n=1 Tax=Larimichthys crocea TaxID=215358 RepID=A0ACD3R6A8_LARCR|nr:Myosin light chain kinase, smooth muscle [Larimichthys crocea]